MNKKSKVLKIALLATTQGHKPITSTSQIKQKLPRYNRLLSILLSCITLLITVSMTAYADDDDDDRHFHADGRVATGVNDLCGVPLFNLDVPAGFIPTFHIRALAEYDPNGEVPIPLTPINCDDDIVLSNYTELGFLNAVGLPDINPRLKNTPLRDMPVISSANGTRSALPSIDNVPGNAFPPTKSSPNEPITLGNWMKASGEMDLTCRADGTAKIKLKYKNLIANGIYSVWALWNTTPPGAPGGRIVPLPLGGIPNIIVPDAKGKVTFVRELASCPKDVTADGSFMMFIDVAYHSDSNISGAFPQIIGPSMFKTADGELFSSPLVIGAVTHDHVLILISGEEL